MRDATIRVHNGVQTTGSYTSEFLNALAVNGKMISARLYSGTSLEFDSEEIIDANLYYEGSLLKSVMYCLEVTLAGLYYLVDDMRFTDFQFGVSSNQGTTYYYVSYGAFNVVECTQDLAARTTKLVMYDDLINSMKPYNLEVDRYPITNYDYLGLVMNAIGLNLDHTTTIPNTGNMSLDRTTETYNDSYTFRDVLDDFAEILGGILCVKGDTLELRMPSEVSTYGTLDETQLKTIAVKEEYPMVDTIVLSRSPQEDNVSYPEPLDSSTSDLEPSTVLRIENNQLVEGNPDESGVADRTIYLEDIYNRITDNWIAYHPVEVDSYGYMLFTPGDIITFNITTDAGTTESIQTIWLSDNIDISQGLNEKMRCEAPASAQTDISKSTSDSIKERATYLYVDKVNGEIVSAVSAIEDINHTLGVHETQIEQNAYEISQRVTSSELSETLDGYVTNTQLTSELQQTSDALTATFTTIVDNEVDNKLETWVVVDSTGITIAKSDSNVKGIFTDTSLDFVDQQGNKLAWLDASEGLGATQLSVGDPESAANRWRIFVSADGSHLRFTRHS